jgi:hypothetical protein
VKIALLIAIAAVTVWLVGAYIVRGLETDYVREAGLNRWATSG